MKIEERNKNLKLSLCVSVPIIRLKILDIGTIPTSLIIHLKVGMWLKRFYHLLI